MGSGKVRVDLARHLPESSGRKLGIMAGQRSLLYLDLPEIAGASVLDWDVHVATDIREAQALLRQHEFRVAVVLLDPVEDRSVLQDIEAVLSADGDIPWVALLSPSCAQQPEVCRLLADHCHDYHTLPFDPARLLITLGHAYGMAALRRRLPNAPISKTAPGEMVGTSPAMQRLFPQIGQFATVEAPVLLLGETGTGKELAACAVHQHSARSGGPFLAINGAALPPTLIQSELFGHEKGGFTGADRLRVGRFKAASSGTIFLDEIGSARGPSGEPPAARPRSSSIAAAWHGVQACSDEAASFSGRVFAHEPHTEPRGRAVKKTS
jgi:DNA-binding NtrC family response regulator